jgi:hypothetical protein
VENNMDDMLLMESVGLDTFNENKVVYHYFKINHAIYKPFSKMGSKAGSDIGVKAIMQSDGLDEKAARQKYIREVEKTIKELNAKSPKLEKGFAKANYEISAADLQDAVDYQRSKLA